MQNRRQYEEDFRRESHLQWDQLKPLPDWKRHEKAKRLRDTGLTLKAIGAALGVSAGRVRQMLAQLKSRVPFMPSELEDRERLIAAQAACWWYGLKFDTKWELEQHGFNNREACKSFAADELTMWRGYLALPGWEEERDLWKWSERKLSLGIVNEVRAWLGVAPYVPGPRVADPAELERARRLLERHGWRVEPPNAELTSPPPVGFDNKPDCGGVSG